MISYQSPALMQDLAGQLLANVEGNTPFTIEQIDILLRLVSASRESVRKVLCLGADLAVLASAILEDHQNAEVCLLDEADHTLATADDELRRHDGRFTLVKSEPNRPGLVTPTYAPTFDVILCGGDLRLAGRTQRTMFAECLGLLNLGGLILMVRNVASATRWTESRLDDYLIDAIFGEELRTGTYKSRAQIAREHFERVVAVRRDTPAPLEVQCDWLRELGYENVDCFSKIAELAVYGGQRPLGSRTLRD
jgi:hypothetical protein